MSADRFHMLLRFPSTCDAERTVDGELDACGSVSVAVAIDADGHPYPVCKHHARGRTMLPLASLLRELGVIR